MFVKPTYSHVSGTEDDPYHITTVEELNTIRFLLSSHFVLVNDLDFEGTPYDSLNSEDHRGWTPLGDSLKPFTGSFNGKKFTIDNLHVNGDFYAGLFGYVENARIDSIRLKNASAYGIQNLGTLAGYVKSSTINNCFSEGVVSGYETVGGLVGSFMEESNLSTSYFEGNVECRDSYAGGLIAVCNNSSVSTSYSTGIVESATGEGAGGLIGEMRTSSVTNSFSRCDVIGRQTVGGLVGNFVESTMTNCYSAGQVGEMGMPPITEGIVGFWSFEGITSSYIDQNLANAPCIAGTPSTTEQMMQSATYTGWDFDNVWQITEGESYPTLLGIRKDEMPVSADFRKKPVSPLQKRFEPTTVAVYTLSGRVVYRKTFERPFVLNNIMTERALSKGTYLVRIKTRGMKSRVKRFIRK